MNKKYIFYVFNKFNYNVLFYTDDIVHGLIEFRELEKFELSIFDECIIDYVILPSDLSFTEWSSELNDI